MFNLLFHIVVVNHSGLCQLFCFLYLCSRVLCWILSPSYKLYINWYYLLYFVIRINNFTLKTFEEIVKTPRAQFGIKMQLGHCPIHQSLWGKVTFLYMGHKKDLPQFSSFLIHRHKIFKTQTFNIKFLNWDSCLNYIFRWVLSIPKFCALVHLTTKVKM